ncbi:hypothetical protein BC941DRAFT_441219 [Chlamydoabsidia padenii]|nr:hypothetical protein BC941DRAFT_441219 [Chlamydoabsidia padenii]
MTQKAIKSRPAYHDIQGYMPKRQEFEVEYDNSAEQVIKDLAFYGDDSEQDIRLKLTMLGIYNSKLDKRSDCKRFVFDRHWLDFRAQRLAERKRTRPLINDTRVFCRLQTAKDYDQFIKGLVREFELRERISQLQHWRLHGGVTTLRQGDQYEQDKLDRIEYLKLSLEEAHERLHWDMMPSSSFSGGTSDMGILPANIPALQRPELLQKSSSPITPSSTPTQQPPHLSTLPALVPSRPPPAPLKPKPTPSIGRKPANPLDISSMDGVDLLSSEEQVLCSTLRLLPRSYLVIKDTILKEYAKHGFLKRRAARSLIKIDVNKTSRIYDFFIESGWITATKPNS